MDSITIDLETVTSPSPVNFWIWCSIGYSILGYALISFLIIRFAICKKFNNVVYRLIQVDLMINIGCHLFSMLSFRLQSLKVVIPFLKLIEYTFPGSFTLLMKSSFFFLHSQFLSIFVVNFSRILPFFHLGVYLKAKYPKWYYLVYGVAILFTSFLITWSCFEYFLDGNFYEISLVNKRLLRTRYLLSLNRFLVISGCFSTVYFFILSVEAILITRKYTKYLKKYEFSKGISITKHRKVYIAHSFSSSFNFIWSLFQLLNSLFHFIDINVHVNAGLLGTSSDIMVFSLSVILLMFDQNVWEDFIQVISCGKWIKKESATVSHRQTTTFIVRQFRVTLDKGAADTTSYYPIRSEAADLKNVDDVLEVERGHKIRCKFSAPPRTKQLSIALERAEQE